MKDTTTPKKSKGRPKKVVTEIEITSNDSPVVLEVAHAWESETEVGQFLAAIISMSGITKVLELGTLTGKTTSLMLSALPVDGKLTTIDIKDLRSESFKKICKSDNRLNYINGDSIQTCQKLSGEKFELIYIDTIHEYAYALPEFKAIERIIEKGCILAYHDSIKFEGIAKLVNYAKAYKYNAVTFNTPNANGLTLLQR